ncbi:ketopantoate reductase family protein [Desulfosarcina ovata]|nr:ketopantoate reductase family protein [Desulfosarcina ovata]
MKDKKIAVVGIGATGSVLAAALLQKGPDTILVDPAPGMKNKLLENGINITGEISYPSVPVTHFCSKISEMENNAPDIVFIATKTFYLPSVIEDLKSIAKPGIKIISTHNGLGTEDMIAKAFGAGAAFRMSLNFGVALKGPGAVEAAFFNRPNHLGCLDKTNTEIGKRIAELLTSAGLDTELVDDIKLYVWKKMILKCTMASICAVTDKSIKDALTSKPAREIAEVCFREALAVAKAQGYDLGEKYLTDAFAYLEKVGIHKDSMCGDLERNNPTEIDFLGGKVVEYARELGISVPYYTVMTNLVKELDKAYSAN